MLLHHMTSPPQKKEGENRYHELRITVKYGAKGYIDRWDMRQILKGNKELL